LYQADVIYADMHEERQQAAADLFVGSETTKNALFAAITRAQGNVTTRALGAQLHGCRGRGSKGLRYDTRVAQPS
jgi:small ligand-binding sensory domain FIST